MSKSGYKDRDGVDWYDESMGMPKHNQKHRVTKRYYNEFKEEWCSKRSKKLMLVKSKMVLFDFKYYPIDKIKVDYGPLDYEKVAMFISRLYMMHYCGYKAEDWEFVYLSYDDLVLYLGVRWIDILEKLNDDGKVIYLEKPLKRDPSKMLKYFKLNKAFREVQGNVFSEVGIKDGKYEDRILGLIRGGIKGRVGIDKAIERTLDKTELVIKEIESINEAIWDAKQLEDDQALLNEYTSKRNIKKIHKRRENITKSKKEYQAILNRYYEYLCKIQACTCIDEKRALYGINTDSFGYRISHMYSNAPKLYRRYLKIDGEAVVEIDIKSSQPSFLHALIVKWFDIDYPNRFLALPPNSFIDKMQMLACSDRLDLYKYMAMKVKGLSKIGDTATRTNMKSLFYSIVLGNPWHKLKGKNKKKLVDELFGIGFYDFLVDLANIDFGLGVNRKDKNLAALLQREESAFLLKIMEQLNDKGFHFLPLYDSVIVKAKDAEAVRAIFEATIADQMLTGIIRIK